jgi:hypothetical protein
MAARATLKRFDVEGGGDAFILRIEDADGNVIDLQATRDQLDMLADALDDVLLHDGSPDDD